MKITNTNTSIICPYNDGEICLIVDIAKKLNFDVRVSNQTWGAVLSKELDETFVNLKENVIIIEMPGIEKENEIKKSRNLIIIDHHKYQDLDRSNPKSSLEQFADIVSYKFNRWEMGIALNDRGYIYALKENGYNDEEIKKIREFDLSCQGYKAEDFKILEEDYRKGYIFNDSYIVETKNNKTSYLADLHFLENEKRNKPLDLFVFTMSGEKKINEINFYGFPETAKTLYAELGGWCGGDEKKSMFWGWKAETEMAVNDFLLIISKYRSLKK